MCLQIKMGYTLCSHVAYDLYILKCQPDNCEDPCDYKRMGIPDWVWSDTQEVGKCHFCMLEESDRREKRRRMNKLDLDREGDEAPQEKE
jgi:hypothetical protein